MKKTINLSNKNKIGLLWAVTALSLIGCLTSLFSFIDSMAEADKGLLQIRQATARLELARAFKAEPSLPPLAESFERLRFARLQGEKMGLRMKVGMNAMPAKKAKDKIQGISEGKIEAVIGISSDEDLLAGTRVLENLIHQLPVGDLKLVKRGGDLLLEGVLYGR